MKKVAREEKWKREGQCKKSGKRMIEENKEREGETERIERKVRRNEDRWFDELEGGKKKERKRKLKIKSSKKKWG